MVLFREVVTSSIDMLRLTTNFYIVVCFYTVIVIFPTVLDYFTYVFDACLANFRVWFSTLI